MKTLSQIINSAPAVDLVEGTAWKFLSVAVRALGFEAATGSDLRSFKGIAKDDIYNLYGIRMRAGKWADVWFAILKDDYAVVSDEKVMRFDHMGDAIKAIQKIGVQQKKTATEDTLDERSGNDKIISFHSASAKKAYITKNNLASNEYKDYGQAGIRVSAEFVKNENPAGAKDLVYRVSDITGQKEDVELNEEVDYYKFKQLAILGLLSPSDAAKAALGMKAIEGGHPATQEQKKLIGDTLVMLVSMITGDSAVLNKLKKTARDAKNAAV
jgi:hypothetical protein